MGNQEKDNQQPAEKSLQSSAVTELAKMDIQCHLIIKDDDSDSILVNQRG